MTLTAEERQAIAEFPSDQIQRIPRGASSQPSARWDEKENKLRNAHHCGAFYNREEAMEMMKQNIFKTTSDVSERRRRVRELAETMTVYQIAVHLNATLSAIQNDLRKLGVKAKPADRADIGNTREVAAKRKAAVAKAWDDGARSVAEVAKAAGVERTMCRDFLIDLGLLEAHVAQGTEGGLG